MPNPLMNYVPNQLCGYFHIVHHPCHQYILAYINHWKKTQQIPHQISEWRRHPVPSEHKSFVATSVLVVIQFHLNSTNCHFIVFQLQCFSIWTHFQPLGYTNAFLGRGFAPKTIVSYLKRSKSDNTNTHKYTCPKSTHIQSCSMSGCLSLRSPIQTKFQQKLKETINLN